jgi:hypothetical protein
MPRWSALLFYLALGLVLVVGVRDGARRCGFHPQSWIDWRAPVAVAAWPFVLIMLEADEDRGSCEEIKLERFDERRAEGDQHA